MSTHYSPLNTQQSWTRDGYLISTDPKLIPIPKLIEAFASQQVYWAQPLPEAAMRDMLDHSLSFGLYTVSPESPETPSSLIGFARCITDQVTFLYLTDVYVLPEHQSHGLGKWLVGCVQQVVEQLPYLRRSMLIIGHGREERKRFYAKLMHMVEVVEPVMVLNWKGPGNVF